MDIVEKLQEHSVRKNLSKGLDAAHALAREGRNAKSMDEVIKALDTQETGGGAEFVFIGMSTQVINQVRQELIVASTLRRVPMPTNPFKSPVELGPATAYLVPENTGDTGQTAIPASQLGTAGLTLSAKSIGAQTRISKELTQDSIIPMVPLIQENLLRSLADGLENALLIGDITGSHQDSDITGATNVAKAWPGMRKLAIANNYTLDISTWSLSKLRGMRKKMGKYGINPRSLVLIVSNSAFMQMLNWAEVVTRDKLGPNATVLTGELLKVDGISVLVSPHMRENLNVAGVYDGTTATKTGALLVHRDAFAIGDRQEIDLDQTDEPKAFRQRAILADMRVDFLPIYPIATNPVVVYAYNLTS